MEWNSVKRHAATAFALGCYAVMVAFYVAGFLFALGGVGHGGAGASIVFVVGFSIIYALIACAPAAFGLAFAYRLGVRVARRDVGRRAALLGGLACATVAGFFTLFFMTTFSCPSNRMLECSTNSAWIVFISLSAPLSFLAPFLTPDNAST